MENRAPDWRNDEPSFDEEGLLDRDFERKEIAEHRKIARSKNDFRRHLNSVEDLLRDVRRG